MKRSNGIFSNLCYKLSPSSSSSFHALYCLSLNPPHNRLSLLISAWFLPQITNFFGQIHKNLHQICENSLSLLRLSLFNFFEFSLYRSSSSNCFPDFHQFQRYMMLNLNLFVNFVIFVLLFWWIMRRFQRSASIL